jgi:hypothetical protein
VKELVRINLAEAELGAVADQPLVGVDGSDVYRLADNVLRHVRRRDVLSGDVGAAVLGAGVVEQPLLEGL